MTTFAQDWKVEAATSWNNDKIYFFNGNEYHRYDVKAAKIDDNYPMEIEGNFANGWPSGWNTIDAATHIGKENVYFFKWRQYIRYESKTGKVASGYPKKIMGNFSKNWPSDWPSVEAAVNLGNGNIYFFRGQYYIKYNIESARVTEPKSIPGNFAKSLPKWFQMDAAVNIGDGKVYFFKGDEYIIYNINGATVSSPQKVYGNFVKETDRATSLRLIKIKCIKPATGVESHFGKSLSEEASAAGVVMLKRGRVSGMSLNSGASALIAELGGSSGGISLGSWISTQVDRSRKANDLYIKADNKKVWPVAGQSASLSGGQELDLNIRLPLKCILDLMKVDKGSADDSMGQVLYSDFTKGTYELVIRSNKEDSIYLLTIKAN